MNKFAERLKELRKFHKVTQNKFLLTLLLRNVFINPMNTAK